MKAYDEDAALTDYVWRNYHSLMTAVENSGVDCVEKVGVADGLKCRVSLLGNGRTWR
ncbi:MAG: hypothetical protein ACRD1B_10760 [Thermoanaerobaculia bacterium]